MRHFVMIRSSYGPGWDAEANERRLRLTRGVTVRSLAAQTDRDFELVVLLDDDDPNRQTRLRYFQEAGVPVRVISWRGTPDDWAPWDKRKRFYAGVLDDGVEAKFWKDKIAATAYKVDWAGAVDSADGPVLMTRLDDDDALTPTTLARVHDAARGLTERTALIHPVGFRVWAGNYSRVRHPTNAMQTLFTPDGDRMTVYDYGHRKVAAVAPVVFVDQDPAWLWVRHRDTISGWKKGDRPITSSLRRLFPIDWTGL